MTNVIEDNFIDLQKKATHVLVEQTFIISGHDEQEQVDNFLDQIGHAKKTHQTLIPEYRLVIEAVVTHLSESRSAFDLISIAESINNLVSTTKRLIKSLDNHFFKGCFKGEIKEYKLLLSDIGEVLVDIKTKLTIDKEMDDLLSVL